jgi:hypothetical protein
MSDIQRQISYWQTGTKEDWDDKTVEFWLTKSGKCQLDPNLKSGVRFIIGEENNAV